MSNQIYYYSGTGNSLHVARELQKRIQGTELIPILGALKKDKIEVSGEIIGFVFPVYAFSLPLPVKQFLKRVIIPSTSYVFAIATRGGSPCRVFEDMDFILRRKGKRLDARFFIEMPSNYMLMAPHKYEPETQESIMKNEKIMLERMDIIYKIIRDILFTKIKYGKREDGLI